MTREEDTKMEDAQPADLNYDPDQDRTEKRQIRADYRALLQRQDERRRKIAEISVDELAADLQQSNELYNKVRNPQEATLDSKHLLGQSEMGAQLARAMKHDVGGFDVDDYISKLVTFMGGRTGGQEALATQGGLDDSDNEGANGLDWAKIGRFATSYTHRVPVMDFMYGPLSIEQKKRKVTQRAKLDKNEADKKAPQQLTEDDIVRSENETAKNVASLLALLSDHVQPVNMFKFIVNPNSFSQTVENLFYLSFLIRDGTCSVDIEEGETFLMASQAPTTDDYANDLRKRQIVMELDEETWKRAVEVFEIKEPMIPHRNPAQTKLGDKWYG